MAKNSQVNTLCLKCFAIKKSLVWYQAQYEIDIITGRYFIGIPSTGHRQHSNNSVTMMGSPFYHKTYCNQQTSTLASVFHPPKTLEKVQNKFAPFICKVPGICSMSVYLGFQKKLSKPNTNSISRQMRDHMGSCGTI